MTICQFSKRPKTPKPFTGRYEDVETNPDFLDPEAGCGCDKNCDRSPGDPCPIAAMPVWEMTLRGWHGDTSEYDHLVKWIKAPSIQEIGEFMAQYHPELVPGSQIWPDPLDPGLGFIDGLDFVLSLGTIWVGEIGRTDSGPLTKMTDKFALDRAAHYSVDVMARYLDPEPIDLEEFNKMRLNSWEFELLMPKWSDRTLIQSAKNCLRNCSSRKTNKPSENYDKAAIESYLPLLIERLENKL